MPSNTLLRLSYIYPIPYAGGIFSSLPLCPTLAQSLCCRQPLKWHQLNIHTYCNVLLPQNLDAYFSDGYSSFFLLAAVRLFGGVPMMAWRDGLLPWHSSWLAGQTNHDGIQCICVLKHITVSRTIDCSNRLWASSLQCNWTCLIWHGWWPASLRFYLQLLSLPRHFKHQHY